MPHTAPASGRSSRPAGFVRHLLLAVQYFTRVPLPGRLAAWVGYSPAMMKAATAHFPGVGWLVAGMSAAVLALAWWLLGGQPALAALVAVVLSMIASAWITGAIHEDGLADVCDGLGGSADRETALRIMKDSRLGSYAAMALVLALLLKAGLLALLLTGGLGQAVLVAHVLSRWAAMGLPQWLPYVGGSEPPRSVAGQGEGSKARALVADLQWASFGVSTAWALPAMAWLVWASGWATLAWTLLAMGLLTWRLGGIFRRRLGGITGDCLGATQQLTELAVYLVLAVRLAPSMPSVGS